mmetsp:Transcript_93366/g.241322  ORF Transcript_93366/g.241322 Transcript_93366/m.241322 type:complete len:193 (+) Transcript_93366:64-642(+)
MGQSGSICCCQLEEPHLNGFVSDVFGHDVVLAAGNREVYKYSNKLDGRGVLARQGAPDFQTLSRGGNNLEPGVKEWTVTIDRRHGGKLGLDVDQLSGNVLIVDAVTGGLVGDWNAAHPHLAIRVSDWIMEVNGLRGDGLKLVEECKKDQLIGLVVQRHGGACDADGQPVYCRGSGQCETPCRVPCMDAPRAS